MSQLSSLLEKLGLKYEDLTQDEKKTYQSWSEIYSQPDVSIDDLKKFLPIQIESLEYQLTEYENSPKKDVYLKGCLRNLKMIRAFITGPEKRKQWLEKHIEQRTKN